MILKLLTSCHIDIWALVIDRLDYRDIQNLELTCKQLRSFVISCQVWKRFATRLKALDHFLESVELMIDKEEISMDQHMDSEEKDSLAYKRWVFDILVSKLYVPYRWHYKTASNFGIACPCLKKKYKD